MMNRLMILGPSGTGKTTICRILAEKLELKALHLDSVYWKKDWHNISKEEFDTYMQNFFRKYRRWAVDGNYTNNRHFQYRLDLADTIILLDFGLQVSLKGIHQRALQYKHRHRSDMAEGCIEGIDQEFLQYVAFYKNKGRYIKALIKQYENKKKVLIFKSRKAVHEWIKTL